MAQTIRTSDITGLVLAGGQGSRMGGVDKGLQLFGEVPLALRAMQRLLPQVGRVMVNANRNQLEYEFLGAPVWPDASRDFAGPLAGFLAGLTHCETPFLATVPCDVPHFPLDLVARLAEALDREQAGVAVAQAPEDGVWRMQPVFCLMRVSLRDDLAQFMAEGGRKVGQWVARHNAAFVRFDEGRAFANANTLDELKVLAGNEPSPQPSAASGSGS